MKMSLTLNGMSMKHGADSYNKLGGNIEVLH